jgi:hypothetical protein
MIERPLARATLARQLPPAGVQSGGTLAPEGDLWRNIFWALAGAAATGARILIGIVLIIFLLVVLGLFAVS